MKRLIPVLAGLLIAFAGVPEQPTIIYPAPTHEVRYVHTVEIVHVTQYVEPELTYLGTYRITGYDPYCKHCCKRADGITASGSKITIGKTVAMSGLDFGTVVYIDGLGYFTVEDGGVGDGAIDVAVDSHTEAYEITGKYQVWVVG